MTEASDTCRLPPIAEVHLTEAQRQARAAIMQGPRGRLSGPFVPLLRSPELCQRTQLLGEYLRFGSVIPQRLRELAILSTARHWRQSFEWQTHAPIAQGLGLAAGTLAALAAGLAPDALAADEAVVLEFCHQLHTTHAVSDQTYAAARDLLGEPGVIELCGLCGYYALLAMVLNVARTPPPVGGPSPFPE
ncbi:MAG: carboxymuconolactone decarboxylase family protein [Steroidobacteraceae bacterium]